MEVHLIPQVLGLGCKEAEQSFREEGLELSEVPSLEHLLKPNEELLLARAIVLRHEVLGECPEEDIQRIKRLYPLIDVVVWSPDAGSQKVRSLLRSGVKDIELSDSLDALAGAVSGVIANQEILPRVHELQDDIPTGTKFSSLRSRNGKMWDLFGTCKQVAETDVSVLVLGETGTGKELFARAIHRRSKRSGKFIAVNCGAIPESLIDSELFGHVKGSFTGAGSNKLGLFRSADKGTLFLDELGNIPLEVQFRLLRVLQEGKVRPVGGHEEISVDVRVVAATNAPLETYVEQGTFREDLFYRLDVIRLEIPPLRERPEDILFLFSFLMNKMKQVYDAKGPIISGEFLDQMLLYPWPGNVRELENFVERLILTMSGTKVDESDFYKLARGPVLSPHPASSNSQSALSAVSGAPVPAPAPAPATASPIHRVEIVRPAVHPVRPSESAETGKTAQSTTPKATRPAIPPTFASMAAQAPRAPAMVEQPPAPVKQGPTSAPAQPAQSASVPKEPAPGLGSLPSLETADLVIEPPPAFGHLSQWTPNVALSLEDNLKPMIEQVERAYLTRCLEINQGRIGEAAEQAGVNRRTLLRKLKQYNIDKMDFR